MTHGRSVMEYHFVWAGCAIASGIIAVGKGLVANWCARSGDGVVC